MRVVAQASPVHSPALRHAPDAHLTPACPVGSIGSLLPVKECRARHLLLVGGPRWCLTWVEARHAQLPCSLPCMLKRTPLAGDLLTELALKSVSMRAGACDPPCLLRSRWSDDSKAHATYRKYQEP